MSFTQVQKVRILYKTILRLHRSLPTELQSMGDNYARDEFKRHKKCTEQQGAVFLSEWTDYALTLASQLGLKGLKSGAPLGKPLSPQDMELFRDEQVQQLYELMLAATEQKDSEIKNTR